MKREKLRDTISRDKIPVIKRRLPFLCWFGIHSKEWFYGEHVMRIEKGVQKREMAKLYCLHCNAYLGELIFERKSRFPKDYKEFKKLMDSVFPYGMWGNNHSL